MVLGVTGPSGPGVQGFLPRHFQQEPFGTRKVLNVLPVALWREEKPVELTLTEPYPETFFPATAGGQGVNVLNPHAQCEEVSG